MKAELLRVWLAEAKHVLEREETKLITIILNDADSEHEEGFFEALEQLVFIQTALESITTRIALLKD